jgi:hypothetical protein
VSRELRVPWSSLQYVILGDDILIGDPRVGMRYTELISQLGVEVSPVKSFISSEICEFAKRYLRHGVEVSPFPVSSISEEPKDVSLWVSSLMGERRKGFAPVGGISGAVYGLSRSVYGRTPGVSARYADEAFLCETSTNFLTGVLTSGDYLAAVCGPSAREWSSEECELVLKNLLVGVFAESLTSPEGGLAGYADRALIRVWDETDHGDL